MSASAAVDNPAPGSRRRRQHLPERFTTADSENGSLTTKFSVHLPRTRHGQGAKRCRVRTACLERQQNPRAPAEPGPPGTANLHVGISSDQFALFRVSVKLPEGDSVTFPANQTYSHGTVVRWDQAPLPGGGEPEYRAPVLSLTGTASEAKSRNARNLRRRQRRPQLPTTPRARLAGAGTTPAAVGLAAALISRRRT